MHVNANTNEKRRESNENCMQYVISNRVYSEKNWIGQIRLMYVYVHIYVYVYACILNRTEFEINWKETNESCKMCAKV